MTYGTRTDHYPWTSKLLHWMIAACVLTTAPVAIAMGRVSAGPTQDNLYNFHKSLGVLILTAEASSRRRSRSRRTQRGAEDAEERQWGRGAATEGGGGDDERTWKTSGLCRGRLVS